MQCIGCMQVVALSEIGGALCNRRGYGDKRDMPCVLKQSPIALLDGIVLRFKWFGEHFRQGYDRCNRFKTAYIHTVEEPFHFMHINRMRFDIVNEWCGLNIKPPYTDERIGDLHGRSSHSRRSWFTYS